MVAERRAPAWRNINEWAGSVPWWLLWYVDGKTVQYYCPRLIIRTHARARAKFQIFGEAVSTVFVENSVRPVARSLSVVLHLSCVRSDRVFLVILSFSPGVLSQCACVVCIYFIVFKQKNFTVPVRLVYAKLSSCRHIEIDFEPFAFRPSPDAMYVPELMVRARS